MTSPWEHASQPDLGLCDVTGGPSKKERGCLLSFLVPINFGNTNKLPLLGARPLDG